MADLLTKVKDAVGDTERDAQFFNDDLIPNIDTLDFSITYRAGDEVVAVTTATGAPLPTLGAADELIHDMEQFFITLVASRLYEDYAGDDDTARADVDEALTELLLGGDEA